MQQHNDDLWWQVTRESQAEWLEAATRHRQIKQLSVWRPSRKDRLLSAIGGLLIAWGARLQARYEPAPPLRGSLEPRC